ncbi:MAG TPA: hypothetical protein PKA28_18350 [Methylomusa anaerophila]|uniref:Uncharacterized protein n=1 Tax=Methylomusa anaerophila TaxID=1930071 RepID=A0A348AIS5_9FIRM|nr:hypothetical protein [Methylomusa anaerophila]BBB90973.1 hypothetical protein MAMMFC1_01640 [Methylomusa anaerophila]HML90399.1 hypothetical protein [Methylomusa anaerophila]
MSFFWYVCDGNVEEYSGQKANLDNSVIVYAELPEDALIKVMRYYRGELKCHEMIYDGETIVVIS